MSDDHAGTCDIPSLVIYEHGMLDRCSYSFGHDGEHSWQRNPRHMGWTGHREDKGKLIPAEAEHLEEHEDDRSEYEKAFGSPAEQDARAMGIKIPAGMDRPWPQATVDALAQSMSDATDEEILDYLQNVTK